METHTLLGEQMLGGVAFLRGECLAVVRSHHERVDGAGVPDALKGELIPIEARIAAVADSLDAMTSGRPYRDVEMTMQEALQELEDNCGTQFDQRVVEATLAAARKGELHLIPRSAETRVPVSL